MWRVILSVIIPAASEIWKKNLELNQNSHHSVGWFSADAFIAFHVDDARTGILAGEASPTLRGRVSIANNMTLDKLWMVAHSQTFGLIFFCKTDPGIEKRYLHNAHFFETFCVNFGKHSFCPMWLFMIHWCRMYMDGWGQMVELKLWLLCGSCGLQVLQMGFFQNGNPFVQIAGSFDFTPAKYQNYSITCFWFNNVFQFHVLAISFCTGAFSLATKLSLSTEATIPERLNKIWRKLKMSSINYHAYLALIAMMRL